jgi:uncharacterized DUF497 family protein
LEDCIEHIAGHAITTKEVEGACFGKAFVQRVRYKGENPVYYVLGQTEAGRYLFCIIIRFPGGVGYPVTARPVTDKERHQYQKWQRK